MEALDAAQFFCPRCSEEVDPEAAVCSHCGAALLEASQAAATTGAAATAEEDRRDLIDRPWLVLGLLFLATGALGLPILWKSKGFSQSGKIILGVIVTIYTLALIALAALAVLWAWETAQETMRPPG